MSGPSNVAQGDLDEPTQLPVTQVPEDELSEEKKLAEYSQTAEYKRLEKYLTDRASFYQNFLPNGDKVEGTPQGQFTPPTAGANDVIQWKVACIVIKEIGSILAAYQNAREAVDGR